MTYYHFLIIRLIFDLSDQMLHIDWIFYILKLNATNHAAVSDGLGESVLDFWCIVVTFLLPALISRLHRVFWELPEEPELVALGVCRWREQQHRDKKNRNIFSVEAKLHKSLACRLQHYFLLFKLSLCVSNSCFWPHEDERQRCQTELFTPS